MSLKLHFRKHLNGNRLLFQLKQEFDIHWKGSFRGDPVKRSWSEHGEDIVIARELEYLLHNGFYVDVGSNHPTKGSNTFKLYRMGMRGITIEPNPTLLYLHAKYRSADVQLCAACGECDGVAMFYHIATHGLSTLSCERCKELVASGHHLLSRSLLPVLTLRTILNKNAFAERPVFALLSVDAESMDEVVLRSNDWTRDRPRLVVFEENQGSQSAIDYLSDLGYHPIAKCGSNHVLRLRPEAVP